MIKVAICDDDKDIRMKIHLVVKNYFSEIKRPLWSVEFKSGIKLLKVLNPQLCWGEWCKWKR